MNRFVFRILVLFFPVLTAGAAEPVPLTFNPKWVHQLELTPLEPEGWEVRTTGDDPYLHTAVIEQRFDAKEIGVLSLEYSCPASCGLHIYFASGIHEIGSIHSCLHAADGWTVFTADLGQSTRWNSKVKSLRLDFGSEPGKTIRLRRLRLEPRPSSDRQEPAAKQSAPTPEQQEKRELLLREERIERYLTSLYPCTISRVLVDKETVRVEGVLPNAYADVYLCEIAPSQALIGSSASLPLSVFASVHRLPQEQGGFGLELERFGHSEEGRQDRLFARWIVTRSDPLQSGSFQILSHARWADECPGRPDPPAEGGSNGLNDGMFDVALDSFFRGESDPNVLIYNLDGRKWYFDPLLTDSLERSGLCSDPGGSGAIGLRIGGRSHQEVRAAVDFLASRFPCAGDWIIRMEPDKERDSPGPLARIENGHRLMRVVYLGALRHHPRPRVFLDASSLSPLPPQGKPPRDPAQLLELFCRAEGDFAAELTNVKRQTEVTNRSSRQPEADLLTDIHVPIERK